MTVNSINNSTTSYGAQRKLQSTAKQEQQIQVQSPTQQTQSANTAVATAKTTPSSDSLKTIKASMESSSTTSSTTYSAAEIALYDTNGDGDIDAIEALAMKAEQESASANTLESSNYKLDQAIASYGQQNKSSVTNSAVNVIIG